MLTLQDVSFSFDKYPLLEKVSFSLNQGEIGALIGLSGSGKTTLFRLITGLEKPTSGKILTQEKISYMQQDDLLLPWRRVIDNVLLVNELGKNPQEGNGQKEEMAFELLKRVGLKDFEEHYPHELSGGMRQRVSLARALMQGRPLILLDEPFGSLDVIIREELYALIREIRDEQQTTFLLVTHDFNDALALSDKLFILAERSIKQVLEIDVAARRSPKKLSSLTQTIKRNLKPYIQK